MIQGTWSDWQEHAQEFLVSVDVQIWFQFIIKTTVGERLTVLLKTYPSDKILNWSWIASWLIKILFRLNKQNWNTSEYIEYIILYLDISINLLLNLLQIFICLPVCYWFCKARWTVLSGIVLSGCSGREYLRQDPWVVVRSKQGSYRPVIWSSPKMRLYLNWWGPPL